MATDVFPVVNSDDTAIDIPRPTMSGWMTVFYAAMAFAFVFASLRLVYPPVESRTDSRVVSEMQ